jgi:hypothetical protein
MALWKYTVTALTSAAIGASAAVAAVYVAADPLLGATIDRRVAPAVSEEIDAALVKEREQTTAPALGEILKRLNARFDQLESREVTLRMGIECDSFDSPYALTRLGESEPICIVEGP